MKTLLVPVNDHGLKYKALAFICPGCALDGSSGLHMLSVNSKEKKPSWDWDGFFDTPTLSPSILTKQTRPGGSPHFICHSFLRDGKFEFLSDSTHALAGQKGIEMQDLPEWFISERKNR
jgi:hypothetical protein